MDKSLRTWRLTPSKDSHLWSQSRYRGEVWVRAHDAIEARKLAAQRFRVRPDRRRGRMESPWYLRELSRCELDESSRFDSIEMPCVVSPLPDGAKLSEVNNGSTQDGVIAAAPDASPQSLVAHLQATSHEAVASDVRQAIVALLVAKDIDVPGRWLDVYAGRAADSNVVYVVIPARKLKDVIAESLAPLIDRALGDQDTGWILYSEDIQKLLGRGGAKLQAA